MIVTGRSRRKRNSLQLLSRLRKAGDFLGVAQAQYMDIESDHGGFIPLYPGTETVCSGCLAWFTNPYSQIGVAKRSRSWHCVA